SRESARSTDRIDIENKNADDLAESQSNDRQLIAAQSQRGDSDSQPGNTGNDTGGDQADQQQDRMLGHSRQERRHGANRGSAIKNHGGRRIGADGIEAGVTDRKLSGESVDQIQADRK